MKEKIKQLIESITLVEDSYCQEDVEILDIFTDELQEILIDLERLVDVDINIWSTDPDCGNTLTEIRRYFHTLKGSGRMIGAKSSAELAWTIEDLLNKVISNKIIINNEIKTLVQIVLCIYKECLIHDFRKRQEHNIDLRVYISLGQVLQHGKTLDKNWILLLEFLSEFDFSKQNIDQAIYQFIDQNEYLENDREKSLNINVSTLEIDLETLNIFIEESEDHATTIQHFIQLEQPKTEDFNRLMRALHTLRGSSAMAKIEHIFVASSKIEDIFKVIIWDETYKFSHEIEILQHYHDFVCLYVSAIKEKAIATKLEEIYQLYENQLAQYNFETSEESIVSLQLTQQILHLNVDQLLDAEYRFIFEIQENFTKYLNQLIEQSTLLNEKSHSPATQAIVNCSGLLKSAYQILIEKEFIKNNPHTLSLFNQAHKVLVQLFDHLASGQRVNFTNENEQLFKQLLDYLGEQKCPQESEISLSIETGKNLEQIESKLLELNEQISRDKLLYDSHEIFTQFDSDVLDIFTDEADELLIQIDNQLNDWSKDLENTVVLTNLMRYLHTLKGGANMAQAEYLGTLAHHLETIYEKIIHQQIFVDQVFISIIRLIQDDIADRVNILKHYRVDYPAPNLLNFLNNIEYYHKAIIAEDLTSKAEPVICEECIENKETESEVTSNDLVHTEIIQPIQVQPELDLDEIARTTYREEASELVIRALELIKLWMDDRGNRSILLELQRISHTLKGGARLANLPFIADIAYALEIAFEQFAQHAFSSNIYDNLLKQSFTALEEAIISHQFDEVLSLKQSLDQLEFVDIANQYSIDLSKTDIELFQNHFEIVQGDGSEPPPMSGEWHSVQEKDLDHETIKISANLVEKMIDLSGENSINRSRIELDLTQFNVTLNEMELTIHRLVDQLRRMEGELETQIIAKHDDGTQLDSDFDPLEMDQYSSLNQLSKSLAESASDLVDFKMTLTEKIRDTESLLLQQSRIQAEIQEGLMRTRLVPFSRVVPRLQRLVRQISSSLNRPTELVYSNSQGEFDRNILEKMITPFEHMLRNAIDHGIEDADERLKAHKSPMGKISLDVMKHGGEIVVVFSDDGQGIDVKKIKQKAIDQGILHVEQFMDDQDALQLIFNSGLSTAKQVTQISGRGVGLDVVQSEIKSLGGQISVESKLGVGTTFTIRVPVSVAVSDALMVKIADQQFAIPLSQIDRIIRISPIQLEEYFNSHNDYFEIDFQSYKLRYLSEFVGQQTIPKLKGIGHSLPVILVKNSLGQTVAILVDQIIGSRSQIVVKPIGQQFSKIGAIAGATILGDGQVCLILDCQNIARQIQSTQRIKQVVESVAVEQKHPRRHLVMIVDDSVTVRKVTSRLLERQGYEVVTAKDGVDAVEQLENIHPDLMLLDIEMPRMDGFEVAKHVRHHNIHADLPIIMITSRTGEKHRERAFSLGITRYMGKPFQEKVLLEEIENLLHSKIENHG